MGTHTAEHEATRERALLEAARAGQEAAFAALVEPWRSRLHAHCYRMLGSLHDADDALQETLLRAWRAIGRFEGRSSLRGWLYRIATNVCLSAIERRPRRVLPLDHGPAADPHDLSGGEPLIETAWVEPYPDAGPDAVLEQRENVELAFVAALQHLPPNERATLLLREVLGFSAREVAEAMGTTTAAVNSAMQRARRLVDERMPEPSQQATLAALDDTELRNIVERYTTALEEGDMDALLGMITEDSTWSMPPQTAWFRGRDAIARFLEAGPFTVRWRHRVTRANGQVAVACYAWDEARGVYAFAVLDVLRLRGDRLAEVVAFIDADLAGRFGLPAELPA